MPPPLQTRALEMKLSTAVDSHVAILEMARR